MLSDRLEGNFNDLELLIEIANDQDYSGHIIGQVKHFDYKVLFDNLVNNIIPFVEEQKYEYV